MSFNLDWQTFKLEEVLEALIDYRGKTPKKTNAGIPLITAKIVKNGAILHPQEFIDEKDYEAWMVRGFPKPGDVVLTTEAPLGEVAQLTNSNVALAQRIVTLRGKAKVLDNGFLKYFLMSNIGQSRLRERESGTTVTGIKQSELRLLEINLPDFESQKGISKILESIELKLELNNAINKNLEEMAQSIFKRWILDFEFPDENGEPYKSSGGEFEESELGMIPKRWKVGTLGEICDLNSETLSSKDMWDFINYLDTGSITRNLIFEIQKLYRSSDSIPSRARRKIKPNDIVYSTVRPNQHHYGIVKEPEENMLASTGFAVLTSKGVLSNDLVYLWLTQDLVTEKLQSIAESSTSTYPSIRPSDVLSLKIVIPPDAQQIILADIIEVHHNQIWKNQQQNRCLTQIRDFLLPKLMSGEIRVPVEQEYTSAADLPMVAESSESYNPNN